MKKIGLQLELGGNKIKGYSNYPYIQADEVELEIEDDFEFDFTKDYELVEGSVVEIGEKEIVVEPTLEEYLVDLDFRLSMQELGLG
jgi:hypothetical protein